MERDVFDPAADRFDIEHVSDTAWWAAAFRADEGRRPDAAFDDPLASILAGERGRAMARAMGREPMVRWAMLTRTSSIDRLIVEALDAGVDTVVNLGAGLDTRPYRMKLPPRLRWVELDFPRIVALKDARLVAHRPVCQLERVGVDLLDRGARVDIVGRYASTATNMLFIAEGVIPYMAAGDVAQLTDDLRATPAARFWILDYDNAGPRRLPKQWAAKLAKAPFLFDVDDWFAFFARYGWRTTHVITNAEEARRIRRPYPLDFPYGLLLRVLPRAVSEKILSLSGAALLRRDPTGR